MRLFILLTALTLTLAGCTSPETATETLRKNGFTNIQVGGISPWCGRDDDMQGRNFTATNSAGLQVNGTVCCGLWKGCTVRF